MSVTPGDLDPKAMAFDVKRMGCGGFNILVDLARAYGKRTIKLDAPMPKAR